MIESLMTNLIAGAAKGVAGSFAGGVAHTAVADQSFAQVFASIQQSADANKGQEAIAPRADTSDKNMKQSDDQREVSSEKSEKTEKAESTKQDDRQAEEKPAPTPDEMAAKIMARLDQMKAENPDAYAALMEHAGQMDMKDFLTQLGFTGEEIGQFAQAMNLDQNVPNGLTDALANGDLQQAAQSVALLSGEKKDIPFENTKGNAEPVKADDKSQQVKAPVVEARPQEVKQDQVAAKQDDANVRPEATRQEQSTDTPKEQQGQHNGDAKKEARPEAMVSSLADTESRSAMKAEALANSKEHVAAKAQAAVATSAPTAEAATKVSEQAAEKLAAAPAAVNAKGAEQAAAPKAGGASVEASGNATATAKGEALSPEATEKTERSTGARRDFERMLMAQVVDKARVSFKVGGSSQMTMRLDPPHLGKIDMRVMVKDNSVKAVMVAESPEVKAAIEKNIDQLRQQLSAAGMQVDELTVTTADDHRGMAFGQANGDGRNGSNAGNGRGLNAGTTAANDDVNTPSGRDPRHEGLLSIVA